MLPPTIKYVYANFNGFEGTQGSTQTHQIHSSFLETYPNHLQDIVQLLKKDGAQFDSKTIRYQDPDSKVFLLLTPEMNLKEYFDRHKELLLWINPNCGRECDMRFEQILKRLELLESKAAVTRPLDVNTLQEPSSQPHLAILYADPLGKAGEKGVTPTIDAVDYESECRKIVRHLEQRNKNIILQIEIATRKNLLEILQKGPRILHILSHGHYDSDKKDYCLSFEDGKGNLDPIYSSDLKSMLKDRKLDTKLVFTNACHSESVATVFHDAGVPCVVAVQSDNKILDLAAQEFADVFYQSIFEGLSVDTAMSNARFSLAGNYFVCCCAHKHKTNCKWKNKCFVEDSTQAHISHKPNCTCEGRHVHKHKKKKCSWAAQFLESIGRADDLLTADEFLNTCCCSPELPHNEVMKFLMKPDEFNQAIVQEPKQGPLILKSTYNLLKPKFPVNKPLGRNHELYELLKALTNPVNKIILLRGSRGSGKSVLVRHLANYLQARGYFQQNVVLIDMRKIHSMSQFISELATRTIGPFMDITEIENQQIDLPNLFEPVKHSEILAILEDFDSFIGHFGKESDTVFKALRDFGETLKIITDNANCFKVVLTTSKEYKLDAVNENVAIDNLVPSKAAKLLVTIAPPEYIVPSEVESSLKKYSGGKNLSPQFIWFVAQQLRTRKNIFLSQLINELMKNKTSSNENEEQQLFAQKLLETNLSKLKEAHKEAYNLLELLSLFPSGVSIEDLEALSQFKFINPQWKNILSTTKEDATNEVSAADDINKANNEGFKMESLIPSNFVFTISLEECIEQSQNLTVLQTVQDYFSKELSGACLDNVKNKIIYLSAFSAGLIERVRRNKLCFERLVEYSLLCTCEFCKLPEVQLPGWRELKSLLRHNFKDAENKVTLARLEKSFTAQELNLLSLFDKQNIKLLSVLLKTDTNNEEILKLIEILLLAIPTLYRLLTPQKASSAVSTVLDRLSELNVPKIWELRLKIKLNLFKFAVINSSPKKDFNSLAQLLLNLKTLQDNLVKEEPKDLLLLKRIGLEINFVRAYFTYRNKRKKYSNVSESGLSGEEKRLTWALNLIGNMRGTLKELNEDIKFRHLVGRIALLESQINAIIQEEKNIHHIRLKEGLTTAITDFSADRTSIRLEIKAYWLIVKLCQKTVKKKHPESNMRGNVQTVYAELNEVKKKLLQAGILSFLKDYGDKKYESKIKGMIKEINNNYVENFMNVIALLKASPLQEKDRSTEVPTFFKTDLLNRVRTREQNVRFKFEVLTKNSLENTMKSGVKILYLDSETVSEKGLIVESPDLINHEIIELDELKSLLSIQPQFLHSTYISQLASVIKQPHSSIRRESNRLMVVILGNSCSNNLLQFLVKELKIPHVILFKTEPSNQDDDYYYQKLIYESYKEVFVQSFMDGLVLSKSIIESFAIAKEEAEDFLRYSFKEENVNFVELFTAEGHSQKDVIFSAAPTTTIEDISLPRCPTNLSKIFLPMTSRKKEIKQIFKTLKEDPSSGSFVQVIGKEGCGKTRVVLEAAYYLLIRNLYPDGVFYFPRDDNREQLDGIIRATFSSRMLEVGNLSKIFKKKKMLVIFDGISSDADPILRILEVQKIDTIIVTTEGKPLKSELLKKKEGIKTVTIEPLPELEIAEIIKNYIGLKPQHQFPDNTILNVIRAAGGRLKDILSGLVARGFSTGSGDLYEVNDYYAPYVDLNVWYAQRMKASGKSLLESYATQDLSISRNSRFYQKGNKSRIKMTRSVSNLTINTINRNMSLMSEISNKLAIESEVDEKIVYMSDEDEGEEGTHEINSNLVSEADSEEGND